MLREAKFTTSLTNFIDTKAGGHPIELYLFLSMGLNRKGENVQTGERLLEFIRMVNRNRYLSAARNHEEERPAIAKIKIVLSGGLFEEYIGPGHAQEVDEKWLRNHLGLLLENLSPEFHFNPAEDIIHWDTVIDNPLYDRALRDIQNLYDTDGYFKALVDNLIPEHKNQYSASPGETVEERDAKAATAVKNYVFKESAAFLTWGKVVCYPAPSFIKASMYVLEKLASPGQGGNPPYPGAMYLGYEFRPCPPPAANNSLLKALPPTIGLPLPFFNRRTSPTTTRGLSPLGSASPRSPRREVSEHVFPHKKSFEELAPDWEFTCNVEFTNEAEAKNEAIEALLQHIQGAKTKYIKNHQAASPHPVHLSNIEEFGQYAISYHIIIKHNKVMPSTDPFNILMQQLIMAKSSHILEESALALSISAPPPNSALLSTETTPPPTTLPPTIFPTS